MNRKTFFAVASVCLAAVAPHADEARSLDGRIGLGLGAGPSFNAGDYGKGVEPYGRAFLRYNATEWFGLRAGGGYGSFSGKKHFGADILHGGLDLLAQPQLGLGNFRPYVSTGVSVANVKTWGSGKEYLVSYIPAELGLEWLVHDNVSLWTAVEGIVYANRNDRFDGLKAGTGSILDRRDDYQRVTAGVTFRFKPAKDTDHDLIPDRSDKCPETPMGVRVDMDGCPVDTDKDGVADYLDKCAGTPTEARADAAGCPVDGDADGVADYLDKCANTSASAKVDEAGCALDGDKDGIADYLDKCANTPASAKVDASGCPVDTDKDGVADFQDKCPGTAAGTNVDAEGCSADNDGDGVLNKADKCPGTGAGWKVDANGCPFDTDKDGVVDALDKCPGTAAGVAIDADGCQVIKIEAGSKLTLDGIVFQTGKAVVDESSRPNLERAAQAIQKATSAKIEIAGFTDNKGSAAANKKLSAQRANAVKDFLVSLGVKAEQLTAKGYGSAQPVADNKSEAGRAQNRRIEFRVK